MDLWTYDGGCAWKPFRQMEGRAKVGFQNSGTSTSDGDNAVYYSFKLSYQLSRQTVAAYESAREHTAVDVENRIFDQWRNEVSFSHQLGKQNRLKSDVTYLQGNFESPRAKENTFRVGATFEHEFSSYVTGRVGYSFEKLTSEVFNKYSRNLVFLGLALKV